MRSKDSRARAAKWLIELDSAERIEELWPPFQAWLAEDDANREAFARVETAWRALNIGLASRKKSKSIATTFECESGKEQRRDRRLSWWWTLSACALVLIIGIGLWYSKAFAPRSQPQSWQTYRTAFGERAFFSLPDGSQAQLNTDSLIRAMSGSEKSRDVVLERGEVLFRVKKDPGRFFNVRVGHTTVRALGTVFAVRRLNEGDFNTVVEDGQVEIIPDALPVRRVAAGFFVKVSRDGINIERHEELDIGRRLAWTSGVAAFQGETLAEAVAEFNRYNYRQLRIADPSIADNQIGGSYRLNDPDGFAKSMKRMFGIRYEVEATESSSSGVIQLRGPPH
jgi:transmembrane sensor